MHINTDFAAATKSAAVNAVLATGKTAPGATFFARDFGLYAHVFEEVNLGDCQRYTVRWTVFPSGKVTGGR